MKEVIEHSLSFKKKNHILFIDVIKFIHSIEFLLNINIHFEW
jgi:hypothetical protein